MSMPTPLTNVLDAALPREDYCGVQTIANFGNVAEEVAALQDGSAVHDLGWMAFLKVTGEDRGRWLNGMVTNNTRDLEPDHGNYNFILTTQGRIVGDLTAYQRGDHYLMVTSESQREHLLGALNKYIIMDDVELTDISSLMTALGITGPKAKDFCATAGLPSVKLNELQQVQWNGIDITFTQSAESPVPIFQIWLHPDNVNTTWQKLLAAGAKPAGSEAIEKFRKRPCKNRLSTSPKAVTLARRSLSAYARAALFTVDSLASFLTKKTLRSRCPHLAKT